MMSTTWRVRVALAFAALTLAACGGGGGNVTQTAKGYEVTEGVAQKGPLVRGSSVRINELNSLTFMPAGTAYDVSTSDSLGGFKLKGIIFGRQYLEVTASGYYFNELTGLAANDNITLHGLSDLSNDRLVNVNTLTELASGRIRALVTRTTNPLSFAAARAQAQREVLRAFYIYNSADLLPGGVDGTGAVIPGNFSELDISKGASANQILTALSAVAVSAGGNGVGISTFLTNFQADLADDGLINNSPGFSASVASQIARATKAVSFATVATNLNQFYKSTGYVGTNIGQWVDSSGGIDRVIDRYKYSGTGTATVESKSPAYVVGSDDVGQCFSVGSVSSGVAAALYLNGASTPVVGSVKVAAGDRLVMGLTAPAAGTVSGFIQRSAPISGVCSSTTPAAGTTRLSKYTAVFSAAPVSALAAGMYHSLAIRSDGTLWAWGLNTDGQLGDGTTTNSSVPKLIGTGFVSVAAGWYHSLAIKADGTLWAWGGNWAGQLGDGTTTTRLTPVLIGSGYKAVSTRYATSIALKSDGSLWVWGLNELYSFPGAIGAGSLVPTLIDGSVTAIASSSHHGAYIKTDGSLWGWGKNDYGMNGDGTTTDAPSPVLAASGFSGSTLSCGWDFNVSLKPDGSVWTWGYNAQGQIGDGTTVNRLAPFNVGSGFRAAVAGTHHVVAVKNDGTLWTWGYDLYVFNGGSEAGNPNRYQPTQFGTGFTGVIAGGSGFSLAAKTDGSLWAWGVNGYGQLGDGTTMTRSTLVRVLLP